MCEYPNMSLSQLSADMCKGRTSFCAGTSFSPRRQLGFHGDSFLASSHCHPQPPPALLLPRLRQRLCSCASPFSRLVPRHPHRPRPLCDVTWASGVQTARPLDCHCGCGDAAWKVSPPSPARESPWHPIGRGSRGGGARLYGSAYSRWIRPDPREA